MEFCARITKTGKASFKFKIVGFLDINEEKIGQKVFGKHHILGSFRQLPEILKTYMIEEVFFIFRPRDLGYLESLMKVCAEVGIANHLIYNPRKSNPYKGRIDSIAGYPSISYSRLPEKEFSLVTKRMLDIVASGFLLLILSPLFLIIASLIKLTSKGPVFFPWKVVGRNNRDFVGYKFRTMVENAEELKASLMDKNEMKGSVRLLQKYGNNRICHSE